MGKPGKSYEQYWGEDIPDHHNQQAYELAKNSGINILSDKNLTHVLADGDRTIGALWTANNPDGMSFDVAIHPEYRRQGWGSRMVSVAEKLWGQDREAYDENARLRAYAVGEGMPELLQSRGWEGEGTDWEWGGV